MRSACICEGRLGATSVYSFNITLNRMMSFLLYFALFLASAPAVVGGPCDIFATANTPCVAAHSTIRALYANFSGRLYQLRRTVDNATQDIGVLSPGGFADAATHEAFCSVVPPSPVVPIGSTVNIVSVALPGLSFRHCDEQAFVTPTDGNADHDFKVVAALNGDSNAFSLQSINYPTSYIAPVSGAEPGRLGIVEAPTAADASWTAAPAAGGNGVTLTLRSRGLFMAVGGNLTGTCASSYAPPSASVYLETASAASAWILNVTGYPAPAACQVHVTLSLMGCVVLRRRL